MRTRTRLCNWAGSVCEIERNKKMLFDRVIFVENFYVSVLAQKWLADQEAAEGIEFITYLSILSTLGKSN